MSLRPSIGGAVDRQRLRLLFEQARTASRVAIVGALLVFGVFFAAAPSATAVAWLCGVLATTAVRFALYRRFFADPGARPVVRWLRDNLLTAALVGIAWGAVPLIPLAEEVRYLHDLRILVPGFILMATSTSFGVYFTQYLAFWCATTAATCGSLLYVDGLRAVPETILFVAFVPVLLLTARRYGSTLHVSISARERKKQLVSELRVTNAELGRNNELLERQQAQIAEEARIAAHVFEQLTVYGHTTLDGAHVWQQSMAALAGDVVQICPAPDGAMHFFVGDFTGHGLPAALGAVPATAIFQAMASKGMPVEAIAAELNAKLFRLLPSSHFCCAVLGRLDAGRHHVELWNGGVPDVLVVPPDGAGLERLASNSLPLGVVGEDVFDATVQGLDLRPGSRLYAYTDGVTEARNADGEMWGAARLERLLAADDLPAPRLPALVHAVLAHVGDAAASDDISLLEIETTPTPPAARRAA